MFQRADWLCLNGDWEFEMDRTDDGLDRGLLERPLEGRILVPFCPESRLSGIGDEDFTEAVWYRRRFTIPATWQGRRPILHFGAVDHDATVWVNGVEVGRHRGGWTPFLCDLSDVAEAGADAVVVVRARDHREAVQARGKQARTPGRETVFYTRTTGIWQTVWLEPVPTPALARPRLTPDLAAGRLRLEQRVEPSQAGFTVRATVRDASGMVVRAEADPGLDFGVTLDLDIPVARRRRWSPSDPHLYELLIELVDPDGVVIDTVNSYAGLRGVAIDGRRVLLNGEPVFQRLVLDQGYYPDGILTAPSDAALVRDIELNGGGVQRRAPAPEGVRGALPLPRRPAGLPGVGRVRRLGGGCRGRRARDNQQHRRQLLSPSGWRRSSATTRTPASWAGARSTRRPRR